MNNFILDEDVNVELEEDFISQDKFTWDTGIYNCIIKMAYLTKSSGGADLVNFVLGRKDIDIELTLSLYATGGITKGNKPYWIVKKTHSKSTIKRYGIGKKVPLPGFTLINSIIKFAIDSNLAECATNIKPKTIKIYNNQQEVSVLMDLINVPITLAIQEIQENKRINDGTGNYIDTNDKRKFNEIIKALNSEKLTIKEISNNVIEPIWTKAWLEKFNGKLYDKFKEVKGLVNSEVPMNNATTPSLDFDD